MEEPEGCNVGGGSNPTGTDVTTVGVDDAAEGIEEEVDKNVTVVLKPGIFDVEAGKLSWIGEEAETESGRADPRGSDGKEEIVSGEGTEDDAKEGLEVAGVELQCFE